MSTATVTEPSRRTSRQENGRSERSIWLPREHGAYGQLGFPLVTALAIGQASMSAALFALSAVAAFFAHEPLLVWSGRRGGRAMRTQGPRALRAWTSAASVAAIAAVLALWIAPPSVRAMALVSAVFAVGCGVAALGDWERSTAGETLVATACASLGTLVAMAAGVPLVVALITGGTWAVVSASLTLAVRGVIARAKSQVETRSARRLAPSAAALALGGAALLVWFVRTTGTPLGASVASVPAVFATVGLWLRPPGPKRLRVVGWSLMATSAATLVILTAALR